MARYLRIATIVTAILLTAIVGYARFAPLDAPETKLVLPGTVVLVNGGRDIAIARPQETRSS